MGEQAQKRHPHPTSKGTRGAAGAETEEELVVFVGVVAEYEEGWEGDEAERNGFMDWWGWIV